MNKRERQEMIATAVRASGRVRVTELSDRTGVSEMTVRRDLEEMETQGLLLRVHSGAVSTVSRSFEPGPAVRAQKDVEAAARQGQQHRVNDAAVGPPAVTVLRVAAGDRLA